MRILSILIFCILAVTGCSNTDEKNIVPSYIVLAEGDSKLVFLDEKLNILREIHHKERFNNFHIDYQNQLVYAIIDSTYSASRKGPRIQVINMLSGKIEKEISLPYLPAKSLVYKNKAYFSSSEIYEGGMPFFVLDLTTEEVEFESQTVGMVGTIKEYKNDIYITINTGGSSKGNSNLYRLDTSNSLNFVPIINESIELPPGDFIIENNKIYALFAGFAYGPIPSWIKEPEKYTNKLMIFDFSTGKLLSEKKLTEDFPQKMISLENKLYINNYTDLDMRGEKVTILNKETLEEEFLEVTTPSYFTYNSELETFLFSNAVTGSITTVKNKEILKEINVGENSSIVKSVFSENK